MKSLKSQNRKSVLQSLRSTNFDIQKSNRSGLRVRVKDQQVGSSVDKQFRLFCVIVRNNIVTLEPKYLCLTLQSSPAMTITTVARKAINPSHLVLFFGGQNTDAIVRSPTCLLFILRLNACDRFIIRQFNAVSNYDCCAFMSVTTWMICGVNCTTIYS